MTSPTKKTKKGKKCSHGGLYSKDNYKNILFHCQTCGKEMGYDEDRICHPTEETKRTNVDLAKRFHDIYEELAPSFGYETRKDTKEFDPESANGKLMTAVCSAVAREIYQEARQELLTELIGVVKKRESRIVGVDWWSAYDLLELLTSYQTKPLPDNKEKV